MNLELAQIYLDSIKSQVEWAQIALNNLKESPQLENNKILFDQSVKKIGKDCEYLEKNRIN